MVLDLVFLGKIPSSKKRWISSPFVNPEQEVGGLWVWAVPVPEILMGMLV